MLRLCRSLRACIARRILRDEESTACGEHTAQDERERQRLQTSFRRSLEHGHDRVHDRRTREDDGHDRSRSGGLVQRTRSAQSKHAGESATCTSWLLTTSNAADE